MIEQFVNLTPGPVTLVTRAGEFVTVLPDKGGRVRVEHAKDPARGASTLASGRHQIDLHPALWDSPLAGGLGVDDLPDPTPGQAIIVTGHMAEIAALTGREIDDLFVPVERVKGDARAVELHAYASLCPARYATPAMALVVDHIARAGKPVIKRPGVRGCYTIGGYDVRTVLDVLEHFGVGETLASYPRITEIDLKSAQRWAAERSSHARAD